MEQPKPLTMADWRNSGMAFILFGLVLILVMKQYRLGIGFFLVGLVFTAIFQGPKIFKLLKREN